MSETETLFAALRQSSDEAVVDMLERMVRDAPDHALNKMNALDLAGTEGIDDAEQVPNHRSPECNRPAVLSNDADADETLAERRTGCCLTDDVVPDPKRNQAAVDIALDSLVK